jgi:hypothetical protein
LKCEKTKLNTPIQVKIDNKNKQKSLSKSNQKTVSFSNFLNTFNNKELIQDPNNLSEFSCQFQTLTAAVNYTDNDIDDRQYQRCCESNNSRPRSSSLGNINDRPFKSILKKDSSKIELSLNESLTSESDSDSVCSIVNINHANSELNLNNLMNLRETSTFNGRATSKEFLNLVSNKRQEYLNHVYKTDSAINLNKQEDDKTSKKKTIKKKPTLKRSRSADNLLTKTSKPKIDFIRKNIEMNSIKKTNTKNSVKNKDYKKLAKKMKKKKKILGYDWAVGKNRLINKNNNNKN